MIISYRISGTVEVPEGSQIEGERMIRLPDGNFIKLWTGVELNDVEDLDFQAQQKMDVDVTDIRVHLEEND